MEPKFYKINAEVLSKVTKYLGSRPYAEVFKLFEEIQNGLELITERNDENSTEKKDEEGK